MIVGLFCFDGPLYKDVNGNYCSITINNEMLDRYLKVVDKLYLLIRTFNSDKTAEELKQPLLKNDRVQIVEMPNFYELKKFLFRKEQYHFIDKYVLKADLIFARLPSQTSNMVLKRACKHNKPYLAEVGGCAWDSFVNHGVKGMVMAPYMFLEERKYVKHATFCSYVTKTFLQHRYPTKAKNTIVCSNVYISRDKNVLKLRKENIKKKAIVIGTAANSIDVKYKGQDSVIIALSRLKNNGLDFRYQVIGPGSGEYLKGIAHKLGVSTSIDYTGTKTKQEIMEWLDYIDIYIQPSKQEGLPRALIEAMSRGCYCLGSNIAGIPELLNEKFIFTPGDSKKIATLLEEYLNKTEKELFDICKHNYTMTGEYEIEILEERRTKFFEDFKNSVCFKMLE